MLSSEIGNQVVFDKCFVVDGAYQSEPSGRAKCRQERLFDAAAFTTKQEVNRDDMASFYLKVCFV